MLVENGFALRHPRRRFVSPSEKRPLPRQTAHLHDRKKKTTERFRSFFFFYHVSARKHDIEGTQTIESPWPVWQNQGATRWGAACHGLARGPNQSELPPVTARVAAKDTSIAARAMAAFNIDDMGFSNPRNHPSPLGHRRQLPTLRKS